MYHTVGMSVEQVFGDLYASWLRDTHEKNTPESKQLFRDTVEAGFRDRQIVLRHQRLGVNFMNSLATMLHRSALCRLDLHGNALRDAGCEVLAHLMRDLPSLAYLDLGANDMGGPGVQSLGFVVANHRKLSTLLLGSVRDDPYANHLVPISVTILLEGCLRNRTLRTIDLSGNAFGMDVPGGHSVGKECDHHDGEQAMGGTLTAGHTDHTLSTSPAKTKKERGAMGMAAGGRGDDRYPSSMEAPSEFGAHHPMDLLQQLLRVSSTLTTLRLRDVCLSPGAALRLIQAMRGNSILTYLDLSDNDLPAAVGDALGDLLLDRVAGRSSVALNVLVLSGNRLFANEAGPAGTATLYDRATPSPSEKTGGKQAIMQVLHPAGSRGATAQASVHQSSLLLSLSGDRALTTLELCNCGMDDTAVWTLCRALMNNMALLKLSLKRNRVTWKGAVQLGRSLFRHPCLKELYFSENCLEDEGVCALASMLEGNTSLEILDLRGVWLGDRALIALGVALQTNKVLRTLLLSDNHFTGKGGDAFAALLERNHTILCCELGTTIVPHPTILRIQRCIARNNRISQNAEPNALRQELVRLHFQKYKLEEARNELDTLREKNAEVKRTADHFELQCKQDQSDFSKRIRELEEQVDTYTKQEEKYQLQKAKLDADLAKTQESFELEMQAAKEQLEVEARLREKAEEEYHAALPQLEDWKNNGEAREAAKRKELGDIRHDIENWTVQRKDYVAQSEQLQGIVRDLEARAQKKKRKTSKTKKKAT